MGDRLDLQDMLETLLGSERVYFQPPPNIQMVYPCIVYSLSDIDSRHADNIPFILTNEYTLTFITTDPDSTTVEKIAKLSGCSFSRSFQSEQLNHYVFKLNY